MRLGGSCNMSIIYQNLLTQSLCEQLRRYRRRTAMRGKLFRRKEGPPTWQAIAICPLRPTGAALAHRQGERSAGLCGVPIIWICSRRITLSQSGLLLPQISIQRTQESRSTSVRIPPSLSSSSHLEPGGCWSTTNVSLKGRN